HAPEAILPRGQHKGVSLSIKSSKLGLRHGINMDKAWIVRRKGQIAANRADMNEPHSRSPRHGTYQQVATLLQRPRSDKEQRQLLVGIVPLDARKHFQIDAIRIHEQLGVGGWIAAKALLHVQ